MMVGTISGVIVPLVQLGQVSEAADEILKHLKVPEAQTADVKKKLGAYIQMFNDVNLSA